MIKNDRQYRLSKSAAERFRLALSQTSATAGSGTVGVDPLIQQAHGAALRSQLEDLERDIREYEALASGKRTTFTVDSLADLSQVLIKARIACGLSQRELAERLSLKEQQIQRYEADDYKQASFSRLLEVAVALNVQVSDDLVAPMAVVKPATLFARLHRLGFPDSFVLNRITPRDSLRAWRSDAAQAGEAVVRGTAKSLNRIFGWSASVILGSDQPTFDRLAAATARFKLAANAEEKFVSVYALYAHYLALLLLQATEPRTPREIPTDPKVARRDIQSRYREVTFETVLLYCWDDLGIPVLPLNDAGAFHGACWRSDGRNVIVLKQKTHALSRWLNDLLHEFYHAGQEPGADTREILESAETSAERRESDEEQGASWFAGEVILDGRAEQLTAQAVEEAEGDIARLKSAVRRVATRAAVDVGALANYVAFRLSLQGENWWGTATNLQRNDESPIIIARDVLCARVNLERLAPMDRDLLMQALLEPEGE
jgi:transcriptional regulator with XRE-family HTH domain